MPKSSPSICLCMIVKDEATVIKRCLDSVLPIITHWVIVDTGSTDGTQDVIRDYLKGVPGTLYERPWVNFAHNRSEALTLAREHADYSLIIDADDALEFPADFKMPELTADCYTMEIRDPPLLYPRTQLVNNRLRWFYRGVLHEFAQSEEPHVAAPLPIGMRRNHDGARRKDPTRFKQDAEIFEKALRDGTDPDLKARYTFYLAQSYRDAGDREKALVHYSERAKLGGWVEEVYFSLYQVARIKEIFKHPHQEVIAAYDAATSVLPSRSEADHGASRLCRVNGLYKQGYEIARRSLGKTYQHGSLFGEPWIYETGLLDEFAVNAYWVERYEECLDACLKVLKTGKMAGADLERVIANAQAAWRNVPKLGNSSNSRLVQGGSEASSFGPHWRPKIAVITPYYKEPTSMLKQCHASVKADGADVTHFFIADGFPNKELDKWAVRHIRLPVAHADNGNTPRGIGGLLAEVEGFDFIAYLDADNWFHPGHLDSLLELYKETKADVCCSTRTYHQLDGSLLAGVKEPDEVNLRHVDTSCFLLNRSAFGVLPLWLKMPRPLSPVCDRVFLLALKNRRLVFAHSMRPTVAFRSQYKYHYDLAGVPPPKDAKFNIWTDANAWITSPKGIEETVQSLGFYPDISSTF